MKFPKFAFAPVIASGVLYQLGFAPFHLWLLAFVALVPWLVDLRSASHEHAWRSGLIFGWIFWLAQMNWLIPFAARWTGSYALAAIPWLLLAGVLSFYFAGLAVTLRALLIRDRVWVVPFAWAAWEALRSFLPPFAFPWGLLASPLASRPELIQGAAIGEVFFVSAWVALVSVLVMEGFRATNPRRIAHLFLATAAFGFASWMRSSEVSHTEKVVVTVGQPGVDMAFNPPTIGRSLSQNAAREILLAAEQNGSQLVVLPEAISEGESPVYRASPIPILYGAIRGQYQSACVGGPLATKECTDKTRLVMFGEFVPLRGILPLDKVFRLPNGDMVAGNKVSTIPAGPTIAGPSLCFEGLFSDVSRIQAQQGATMLAIMSIDDWYAGTTAMDQLADASVFRAVENGLVVVRAASRGVSQVVDSRGRVVSRAPFGKLAAMRAEIHPAPSDAFAGRQWFSWLAGLITVFGVFWRGRQELDGIANPQVP